MTTLEHHYHVLIETVERIREVIGVDSRITLSELPQAIKDIENDKMSDVFNLLCQIKNLGNDEHMSTARSLALKALCVFKYDENENPILKKTDATIAMLVEALEDIAQETHPALVMCLDDGKAYHIAVKIARAALASVKGGA